MYFAGVDIGSTMTKVVIIDDLEAVVSVVTEFTGPEHRRLANEVMKKALDQARLDFSGITYIVATGYGRINVPFADRQISELTCHARGVAAFFPAVRTAIDIGGQDAKGMKIEQGKLKNFVMNDKCAAGTGRFLEVIADTLGLKLGDLGDISSRSTRKVKISSVCTIFAQQEVASQISAGTPVEDIIAGLHDAISSRVVAMVRRLGIEPEVALTGGVAQNRGVVRAMEDNLGLELLVPEDPFISGALGAAVRGKEVVIAAREKGEPLPTAERRLEEVTFFK